MAYQPGFEPDQDVSKKLTRATFWLAYEKVMLNLLHTRKYILSLSCGRPFSLALLTPTCHTPGPDGTMNITN